MFRRHPNEFDLILLGNEIVTLGAIHNAKAVELLHQLLPNLLVVVLRKERVARQGVRRRDNLLHRPGVGRRSEQAVVQERPVVHVLVAHVLGRLGQQPAQHPLDLRRPPVQKPHGALQQGDLHGGVSEFVVPVDEPLQAVRGLRHDLPTFPQQMDQSGLALGVGHVLDHPGQRGGDQRHHVGMLPQDIDEDHRGLGGDVRHVKVQQVHEAAADAGDRALTPDVPDGDAAQGADGDAAHLRVGVGGVLTQLGDDVGGVVGVDQFREDGDLEVLDVAGLGVADVELAVLVVEDAGAHLDEGVDVAEEAVDLLGGASGDEGDEGGADAADDLPAHPLDVVSADGVGQAEEGPDGGDEGSGVVGPKHRVEEVHDLVPLAVIGGDVPRDELQYRQDAKVGELVDAVEEMEHDGAVDGHAAVVSPGHDLVEDQDAVGHDAGVGIAEHVVQGVDEVGPFKRLLIEVVHLERPHDGRLANVGVGVGEGSAERLVDVLDHLGKAEAAQTPEGQTADHGIVVAAVLLEGVGAHLGQLRIVAGVVAKEEVDHLLDDEIARLDGQHHLREEAADVDPQRHVRDDLLDDLALLPLVALDAEVAQEVAQLVDLSLARFREVRVRDGRPGAGRAAARHARHAARHVRAGRSGGADGRGDPSMVRRGGGARHGRRRAARQMRRRLRRVRVGPGWIRHGHGWWLVVFTGGGGGGGSNATMRCDGVSVSRMDYVLVDEI
mmetsp:Transcript_26135/g.61028  ORF Transcript_26135/g.61028 Transcript_26135/m.61028 type:complete len:721 (-) Transcript_26135:73-2235(-)